MKSGIHKIHCFKQSHNSIREAGYDSVPSYYGTFDYTSYKKIGYELPVKKKIQSSESTSIKFTILDRKFSLPNQLTHIYDEIEYSKELLDLKDNWNFDGGKELDKNLYLSTIMFLVRYSSNILLSEKIIIQSPEISLCPDGSIDLSWVTDMSRLLINFKCKDQGISGQFYGYNKSMKEGKPIKVPKHGDIDMNSYDPMLGAWMVNLA